MPNNKVWRHLNLDRMGFCWQLGRKDMQDYQQPLCKEGWEWELCKSPAISTIGIYVVPSNHNLFSPSPSSSTPFLCMQWVCSFQVFLMFLSERSGPRYIMLSTVLIVYGTEWIKFQNTLLKYEHITILIMQASKNNNNNNNNKLYFFVKWPKCRL